MSRPSLREKRLTWPTSGLASVDCLSMDDEELADLIVSSARDAQESGKPIDLQEYVDLIPDLCERPVVLDAAIQVVLDSASLAGVHRLHAASELGEQFPAFAEAIADSLVLDVALSSTQQCRTLVRRELPKLPFDFGQPLSSGYLRYCADVLIGEGSSGAVFAATDRLLSDPNRSARVAVKILFDGGGADPRFAVSEAIRARRVQHEHVARVLDAGMTSAGLPFVVMELVDGIPLSQWRSDVGQPTGAACARIMIHIAQGVESAHAAGVVHCDLKPSNVLVDGLDTVKLTDFGLARDCVPNVAETFEGGLIGSLGFAAPEQACGTATTASDIYGLGGLLYFLLTGRAPNGTTADRARSWLHAGPDASDAPGSAHPMLAATSVDRELIAVCRRALSRDPGRRHASATEFRQDLEAYLASRPMPSFGASLPQQVKLLVRRRPWATATACAVTIGASLLAWSAWRAAALEAKAAQHRAAVRFVQEVNNFLDEQQGAALDTDGLGYLWVLDTINSRNPIMDPSVWSVEGRSQRIELVRQLIEERAAQGRDQEFETDLWRLTLAFWLVVDKAEHPEAEALAQSACESLEQKLAAGDSLVLQAEAVRLAAIIKACRFRLFAGDGAAECKEHAARAAHALVGIEERLRRIESGSPMHRLALHALERAFGERMLDLPEHLGQIRRVRAEFQR